MHTVATVSAVLLLVVAVLVATLLRHVPATNDSLRVENGEKEQAQHFTAEAERASA